MMHGKASEVELLPWCPIFRGLPSRITVGRYHSLIVDRDTLPQELEVTAVSEEGEIMGLRHRKYPVFGIQFHPESVLTQEGKTILKNFLAIGA